MQLAAPSPTSDPLATLVGIPAPTPAAPAGIATEFSQLVAELSASPSGGNTGTAAAPVEAGAAPAHALWQSLYSTPTQGVDATPTAGRGLNRAQQGTVVTFSAPDSEMTLTDRVESGGPAILGGRGSRSETRGAGSSARSRKAQVGPLPAGSVPGAMAPEGCAAPVAVTSTLVVPDASQNPASASDRATGPESAGEGGTTSTPVTANVSGQSVIGGNLESEGARRGGNSTRRAMSAGATASREVRGGEISGRAASGAESLLSSAGRDTAAQVRQTPGRQETGEGELTATAGRPAVANTAVEQVSPSRLGNQVAVESAGPGIRSEMPAKQSVSASRERSDFPAGCEPSRRPFQNSAPAAAVLAENVVAGPSLAETTSLPAPVPHSPAKEAGLRPATVQADRSPSDLEVATAGFGARELPADARQALRPFGDVAAPSLGRSEPVNLAGGVGALRPVVSELSDARPPVAAASSDDQPQAALAVDASNPVASDEFAAVRAESARESWPTSARRYTQRAAGEKSADLNAVESLRRGVGPNVNRKDFQNVNPERNEEDSKQVGTDSAKSAPTMTSSAFVPRLETATPAVLAVGLPGGQKVEFGVAEWSDAPASGEVAGTAHKAVATVLEWVEQSATRDQHSVSLKFALGETPLRVSVEWRSEEVRTTFHTDSAELRSALAQEWQAVAAKSPERFDRFEAPVFTSSAPASSGLGSSAGDAFARQSHSQTQHAGHESSGYRTVRDERAAATDTVAATLGGNPDLIPATSRHLHTRA